MLLTSTKLPHKLTIPLILKGAWNGYSKETLDSCWDREDEEGEAQYTCIVDIDKALFFLKPIETDDPFVESVNDFYRKQIIGIQNQLLEYPHYSLVEKERDEE